MTVLQRRPPVVTAARDLLGTARHDLATAMVTTVGTERYAAAHLAALRTAAAVLAVRTRPAATKRPRNVWSMLPQVAPELTEWAAFFAAGAAKRAAAEAGSTRAVTEREADDLVRDADRFLAVVEQALGLAPHAGSPQLCLSPVERTRAG
jgi:pyruvate kinase